MISFSERSNIVSDGVSFIFECVGDVFFIVSGDRDVFMG